MTKGPFSESTESSSTSELPNRAAAWQPFTPRGVAAFAISGFGRIFLLLCAVALISAGTVIWFLHTAWFPTIRAAIHELPPQGQIVGQELRTPRLSSKPLAEHRFLGFVVLLSGSDSTDLSSHIAVKFRRRNVDVCSIFGCLRFDYPPGWIIEFNRTELEPRWAAWEPILLGGAAVAVFPGLLLIWAALSFLYSIVAWIVAKIRKRLLSWPGSWAMCAAAIVPGALLLVACVWTYGLGVLDVLQFVVLVVIHFLSVWVYVGFALGALPKRALAPTSANPFAPPVANSPSRSGISSTAGATTDEPKSNVDQNTP